MTFLVTDDMDIIIRTSFFLSIIDQLLEFFIIFLPPFVTIFIIFGRNSKIIVLYRIGG